MRGIERSTSRRRRLPERAAALLRPAFQACPRKMIVPKVAFRSSFNRIRVLPLSVEPKDARDARLSVPQNCDAINVPDVSRTQPDTENDIHNQTFGVIVLVVADVPRTRWCLLLLKNVTLLKEIFRKVFAGTFSSTFGFRSQRPIASGDGETARTLGRPHSFSLGRSRCDSVTRTVYEANSLDILPAAKSRHRCTAEPLGGRTLGIEDLDTDRICQKPSPELSP